VPSGEKTNGNKEDERLSQSEGLFVIYGTQPSLRRLWEIIALPGVETPV
jgi:hypothetical protein